MEYAINILALPGFITFQEIVSHVIQYANNAVPLLTAQNATQDLI